MNRFFLLLILVFACDRTLLGDGPRKAALRTVANEVILPVYDEFALAADELANATAALAEAPTPETLAAARAAWRRARAPWMESQAFLLGPVEDNLLDSAIDQTSEPARIEEILASNTPLTPDVVATLGANRKGFHAIEYLLFGDTTSARRRDYANALAADLATRADELRAAWREGDYVTRFVEIGRPGASFVTIKAAIDRMVNASIFLAEVVQDAKLGRPMGKQAGGVPNVKLAESGPSDNSLDDIAANLRGLRAVWNGSRSGNDTTGLGAILAQLHPALDHQVRAELDAALAAIAAVPRPFADALVARAPELEAAYAAMQKLRRTLSVDVIAGLGATLSLNGNDGD